MARRLKGKTAVITGGSKGIGRGIVEVCLREGAQVLTCGRGKQPDDLPEAVLWQTADLSQLSAVERLAERVTAVFGTLDILVNNAGIQLEKTILETTDDDWEMVMGVNGRGLFYTCRALLPLMNKGGAIVNIGSISGLVADPGLALYNASKAFVHGLTRSIAVDHGPAIRCNAIAPGWIVTGMAEATFALAADPAAAQADALKRHAVRRFGQPQDVAHLAVWLASDEASFVTGQVYVLDGGLTAVSPINTTLF